MKAQSHGSSLILCVRVLLLVTIASAGALAQNAPSRLVTGTLDENRRVTLSGSVHPFASLQNDRGSVDGSFPAQRVLLLLNRPPEREADLQEFLRQAQTPGSPKFHEWLTPDEFGARFGPDDRDVQVAVNWLASHGFTVSRITRGKTLIEFSGTAAQISDTFHSQIHQYAVAGQMHYANASELSIPESLASLVRGVSPINDFRARPLSHVVGEGRFSVADKKLIPQFTLSTPSNFFAVVPEDFANQYDLTSLYGVGVTGSGRTIGVILSSDLDLNNINNYRRVFGLAPMNVQVVIDGNDPGDIPGEDVEGYLDLEVSGGVAPGATVNFYISDGSQVQDPLTLAAIRAVEDDQADVLSASFGQCEANLGSGGNAFWSTLWEQAAAQGQTVMVAAGDSGSAGCDLDAVQQPASRGLAVSGVASTPWNVAVGGTDFYYSDYATGGASIANYWNANNDANYGSLKAVIPEQVWNDALGLNIAGKTPGIIAAGGGASNCSASNFSGGVHVCQSGYAKPLWQNASGVPSDGVRDLPDVSLFAANGANGSAYAICINFEQCAVPGAYISVELVGGTSASAPAMAGIMALVDQKYGRQGQADTILYALSREHLGGFRDVTVGTNNVPCQQGSPNCALDSNGDGLYTLQKYSAGPGYDTASGLGSVDGAALIAAWNNVTLTLTTTSLSISPASFVHGAPVNVNVTVAPSSGSGVPSGSIGFVTNDSVPFPQPNFLALSNGSYTGQERVLPGGTYQVRAEYGGDGVFARSLSPAVSLTVTPEASAIYFAAQGPNGNQDGGGQITYGDRWVFSAAPYGVSQPGPISGEATGSVTVTDSFTGASTQIPLDAQGVAGWSPNNFPVGTHSITLSYSGDVSFRPSTAGPFVFTVVKGTPALSLSGVPSSVVVGNNLIFNVSLGSLYAPTPTSALTITLGSKSQMAGAPLQLDGGPFVTSIYFTTSVTGTFALTVSYPGDANWNPVSVTYPTPVNVTPATLQPTTTLLLINGGNLDPGQTATATAYVSGPSGATVAPTGTVTFYFHGAAVPVPLTVGTSAGGSEAVHTIFANDLANGLNDINAVYSGDANYQPSDSLGVGDIDVDETAFALTLSAPRLVISSGQSGRAMVNVAGVHGYGRTVTLSCSTSSAAIACSVNPQFANLAPLAPLTQVALTVSALSNVQSSHLVYRPPRTHQSPILLAGLLLLALLPWAARRQIRWSAARRLAIVALFVLALGCGGGAGGTGNTAGGGGTGGGGSAGGSTGGSGTGNGSGASATPFPSNTYSVVVTGTDSYKLHDVTLTVVVPQQPPQ